MTKSKSQNEKNLKTIEDYKQPLTLFSEKTGFSVTLFSFDCPLFRLYYTCDYVGQFPILHMANTKLPLISLVSSALDDAVLNEDLDKLITLNAFSFVLNRGCPKTDYLAYLRQFEKAYSLFVQNFNSKNYSYSIQP